MKDDLRYMQDVYRLYANALLFYIRYLNIHGVWCVDPIPTGIKGQLYHASC
jgi:hypothetical protein